MIVTLMMISHGYPIRSKGLDAGSLIPKYYHDLGLKMWLKPLDQSLPRIEARFGLSDMDMDMDMNLYHYRSQFQVVFRCLRRGQLVGCWHVKAMFNSKFWV